MEDPQALNFSLSSKWRFADDKDYLLTLTGSEHPQSVTIKLVDEGTSEEWRNQFDFKYIENLTNRSGHYRRFRTFVAMLRSAVLKKGLSVNLELLADDDIKKLQGLKRYLRKSSSSNIEDHFSSNTSTETLSQNQNKVLVLEYRSDGNKTARYPLLLLHSSNPDIEVMEATIQQLRSEIDQLKDTKGNLVKNLKSLLPNKPASPIESNSSMHRRPSSIARWNSSSTKLGAKKSVTLSDGGTFLVTPTKTNRTSKSASSSTGISSSTTNLTEIVSQLQDQIAEERLDHQEKIFELEAENEYLRNKIKEAQASEVNLHSKVTKLESLLTLREQRSLNVLDLQNFLQEDRIPSQVSSKTTLSIKSTTSTRKSRKKSPGKKKRLSRSNSRERSSGGSKKSRTKTKRSHHNRPQTSPRIKPSNYKQCVTCTDPQCRGCSSSNHRKAKSDNSTSETSFFAKQTSSAPSTIRAAGQAQSKNKPSKLPVSTTAKSSTSMPFKKGIFDPTEYVRLHKLKMESQRNIRKATIGNRITESEKTPQRASSAKPNTLQRSNTFVIRRGATAPSRGTSLEAGFKSSASKLTLNKAEKPSIRSSKLSSGVDLSLRNMKVPETFKAKGSVDGVAETLLASTGFRKNRVGVSGQNSQSIMAKSASSLGNKFRQKLHNLQKQLNTPIIQAQTKPSRPFRL